MSETNTKQHDQTGVVTCLKTLNVAQCHLKNETPLFAAGLEFARETAGPIATAFLDALPAEWTSEHLVVDATLVWLPVGFRHGEMVWCHEPFPGRTDGVAGRSNQEQGAEHIACCCGLTGIEFLTSVAKETEVNRPALTMEGIRERHALLQHDLDAGRLSIQPVPPYALYQYRWGALHRHAIATQSGFHFWIRATRGDDRPLVNGIRNATNL